MSECHDMVCERPDTQECVCGMELERESATETTATDGQGPGSGRSCFGDRAGFARQLARGSGRAAHKAAACSAAQVKPGPETPAVDVADPTTDRS